MEQAGGGTAPGYVSSLPFLRSPPSLGLRSSTRPSPPGREAIRAIFGALVKVPDSIWNLASSCAIQWAMLRRTRSRKPGRFRKFNHRISIHRSWLYVLAVRSHSRSAPRLRCNIRAPKGKSRRHRRKWKRIPSQSRVRSVARGCGTRSFVYCATRALCADIQKPESI